MDYIYNSSEDHLPGAKLDNGPYRLNELHSDEEGGAVFTYLVEPLNVVEPATGDDEMTLSTLCLRILAKLADPNVAEFEVHLPSLDFDINPALDSFLRGNPSPRIVHDLGRDFLIACVGNINDLPIYALTKVTFKRRNDITSGLLTLREAFRFSPHPVFLTQEFSSYSLRQHSDFGSQFLPAKGLRYNRLTRKQKVKRDALVKRKLASWHLF